MTARAITAVLSGGGVKAAAHLGALEVLAQAGHVPTRFVGTSMGAVIGAGLASGLSIAEVRDRLLVLDRGQVASLDRTAFVRGLFAPAMFRGPRLRETLGKLLPVDAFSQLKLPLTVTAADLDTGALVLFGAGGLDAPLADALYASCALPVFYPAAEWQGRRLGDGGLRAVLPLDVAASFPADQVIAIDVGPGFDSAPSRDRPPPALLRAHNDAQHLLMATQTAQALTIWNLTRDRPPLLYVRPVVHRGETFAFAEVDGYMSAGRRAAAAALGRSA